jgi:hypothetical protein
MYVNPTWIEFSKELMISSHPTEFLFRSKRYQFRRLLNPIHIYIFWLPEVQGVQKCKFRRATPSGGGVSLGVTLEKFWDIQNVVRVHNSLSFKFQAPRSNTTPGAVWRKYKITPNTPLSTMRAFETCKFLSSSPVGNQGDLPQLLNVEKS